MSFSGLQIASLGSGSGGNSTLISSATTTLLLDCGFTLKETVARCEKLTALTMLYAIVNSIK